MSRLRNERLAYLVRIIPRAIREEWDEEQMIEAGMYLIGAHEPSHSFIRRPGDQERFIGMYTYMNEMYATVLGLAIVVMRDNLDDDTKNRILAVHFATTA